ncbi:hypothetical protein [Maliponia aquimaris]|uniref:DUF4274 domain-containing protein n=1 Tax=Maliponia aquimaris TaxID=1673631 RepID=A0A238K8M3_9RHOB|nr:hypothetical protein [Maliponia aquimaris]SMX39248.1 hypothetical protein MAA8898_01952 [Maliponia aquimaris]
MDALAFRFILAGLAVGPAAVATVLPASGVLVPLGLVVGGAGSAWALFVSLRDGKQHPRRRGPALLTPATLRRRPRDLPPIGDQRRALAETLVAAVDLRTEPDAPPTRATAVARILARVLDSWQMADTADLPRDLTITLTLLERLLTADPGEAGRIAQMFRRPDLVLALRDEIDEVAQVRAAYDRAFAAFQATRVVQAADPAPRDLVEAFLSMGVPDIDLWHRIVTEHDPDSPALRRAALWCVLQPQCDRATVAAYLARVTHEGQLTRAARRGDRAYLDRVARVIRNYNAGAYTRQELAFVPAAGAAQSQAEELDALADLTRTPRLPDPHCAVIALDGRKPRPRPAWDLANGRLVRPPMRADYL